MKRVISGSRAVAAGPRLYLRPVAMADAGKTYLDWLNDPEVNRYLESRFARVTMPELRAFIRSTRKHPDNVFLAIVLKRGRRHIGNIKLGPINRVHGFGEIGIMLGAKDCWGKGYATEAIAALCGYAFGPLGLHKLTAGAYRINQGSIQAFLKAGFAREGVKKNQYLCDGAYQDLVILGKVKQAPKGKGAKRG